MSTNVKDEAGTYTVGIDGLKGVLKVIEPAELEVRSLEVTPVLVLPGQEATVEANVANVGEAKGTLATTLAEVETYSSEDYLYSISYPSGWVLDESAPEKVTMVKPGMADLGVSILILPIGANLDEAYAILVDDTKKDFPDFPVLSRSEVKEDGTVFAYDAMFTYTDQGITVKMRLVVSKRGRYGFAKWGEAREAVYKQNKPLLDTCLESFKPPVVTLGSYTNTTHGFSLTLSSGWDGLETGERLPLLMIESPVGKPLIYVYVYVDRIYEDTVAKDYALDIAAIWDEEPGYKIMSHSDVTLGEATQGYEVIFTYKEDGYPIKRKVVSVIRGTQAFIVIVYTAASTYDGARSTIDQLTDSFTLVEPKPFGVSR